MARTTRAKRRLLLLAVCLGSTAVAGAGLYGGAKWYASRKATAARVIGYEKYAQGDFAGALMPLSDYVAKNRKDLDALLKLAECRGKVASSDGSKHLRDAAAMYKAALGIDKDNRVALAGQIGIYTKLLDANELLTASKRLLEIEPNNLAALEGRLKASVGVREWDNARKACAQLVALEPASYKWRATLLEIDARLGATPADRIHTVQTWIAAGEPDGRYRLMLADLERGAGAMKEARDDAAKAAELGMPDTKSLAALIELLDALAMTKEAQLALDTARKGGLDPAGIALMQTRRHWLAGRIEDAKTQLAAHMNSPAESAADSLESKRDLLRWKIMLAESDRDIAGADADITALRALAATDQAIAQSAGPWIDAVVTSRGVDGGGGGEVRPSVPKVAIAALDKAMLLDPSDAFLLLRAGDVAMHAGEFDDAERQYRAAYDRDDHRWALAGVRLTTALLAVGRNEDAFDTARELAARFPTSPAPFFVLAQACNALAQEGRKPSDVDPTIDSKMTASFILETLYTSLGEAPTYLPPLVSVYVAEHNDAAALQSAEKALGNPRTSADTLLQIAGLLGDRRFGDVPERAIDAARGRNADATSLVLARARLLTQRGDFAAARAIAHEAMATAPASARAALAQAQAQAAIAGSDSDAPATLSECLREGENDLETVTFVLNQASTWTDESLVSAAIARLRALSGEQSPRAVLADAARVLRFHRVSATDVGKSARDVDELRKTNPKSVPVLITLSRLLASTQPPDLEGATKWLATAVELQPGRRELVPELVALMQAQGSYADATQLLQEYMRSADGNTAQSRVAADLLVSAGQYAIAIPALERVAMQTGSEADLVALADIKRRAGRIDEAEKAFKDALALPDRSALSAMAYAEFLARDGRMADARRMIDDDARREKPALTPANRAYLLARMDLDYGDAKAAGPAVAEAVKLAPDSPGVALLAARHQVAQGDVPSAIATAQAALGKTPHDAQLLAFVSSLLMADPATRAGSDATLGALKAQNPALAELLVIVKASAGPDGTLAPGAAQLKALKELTVRYPTSAAVWSVACEMHAVAGELNEAVDLARHGMARLPSEPGPAEFAARLLLQQRRMDDAREAARSWRALTADSPLEADLVLARIALGAGKPGDAAAMLAPYVARLQVDVARKPEGLALYATCLLLDGKVDAAVAAVQGQLADRPLRAEWLRAVRVAPTDAALAALGRTEAIAGVDDEGRLALVSEYAALARCADGATAQPRAAALLAQLSATAAAGPIAQLLGADLAAARGDAKSASTTYDAVWSAIPAADRERLLRWSALDAAAKDELTGAFNIALYASNNEASALAEVGLDLDKALVAIDRALVMQPSHVALTETKALVLMARREYDQARTLLTPMTTRPDVTPAVYLTLARIELAAGQVEPANRHVATAERLLSTDPMPERATLEQLAKIKQQVEAARKPKA